MKAVFLVRATGGLAAALFAGIALYLAPLEPGVLTLQLAFSPRVFGQVVHLWPAEHLARYRSHFPADFALLACYGAFGWLLATRTALFAGQPALRCWAKWALPLAAAFDSTENALHLWLTEVPRFGVPWAYTAAALAASLKWGLLLAFAFAVAFALAVRER
ncbi:hypothetical protein RAMLITH_01170 [Ramlibacter sp. RBP-2]|uniref:DUF1772 domain-containing protein n=1 Tax=Ramlibacter lithotrophicus TaxID=2606681 RepID=A0A7X6DC60_9BURK|nr:hypothetical protein [Ramlibacter lithotrophicus]NKE64417.1 hypothetical protein [Ramlibacter lithotrophicus]